MLHELIANRNATIPQICARTGMALRTINNALATLRGAGILKARGNQGNANNEVTEKVTEKQGEVTEKVTEKLNEKTVVALPDWIGREVTDDHRYKNNNLAAHPFSEWR